MPFIPTKALQKAFGANVKSLPSSQSLAVPDAPTIDQMTQFSRMEAVPLESARGTQNKMDMDAFNRGEHPGALLEGFEGMPVAARKEDGEYLIYDGHHRAVSKINSGETAMDMHVIDAKDYAPDMAGRKPAEPDMSDDELLSELGLTTKLVETDNSSVMGDLEARSKRISDPVIMVKEFLKDSVSVYAEIDSLRADIIAHEQSLLKKYGVRNVIELEDHVTEKEYQHLFNSDVMDPFEVGDISSVFEPIDSLAEAGAELPSLVRDLPIKTAEARLLYLGSEMQRLGGDPSQVVTDAIQNIRSRHTDQNDADFMVRDFVDKIKPYINIEDIDTNSVTKQASRISSLKYGAGGAAVAASFVASPDESEAASISGRISQAFEVAGPGGLARAIPKEQPVISKYDDPDPSFMDEAQAAFERSNMIGSIASSQVTRAPVNFVDQNFNVFDQLKEDGLDVATMPEDDQDRWANVHNLKHYKALSADIDRESRNRKTLDAGGWSAVGLEMVAAVADPTILLPGGAFVRAGAVGYKVGQTALRVGAASGVATAAQEAGLQATQQTRTKTESALNIGGSVILGGLIGAAGAKFLTRAEWKSASQGLEKAFAEKGEISGQDIADQYITSILEPQSGGSAAATPMSIEDFAIGIHKKGRLAVPASKLTEKIAEAGDLVKLNPGIAVMLSPNVKSREVLANLVSGDVYLQMHMDGRIPQPSAIAMTGGSSAEANIPYWTRGKLGGWVKDQKSTYRNMVKTAKPTDETLSRKEFNERVMVGAWNNDYDSNPHVQKAIGESRKLFDEMKDQLTEIGVYPENMKPVGDATYAPHMWHKTTMEAREGDVFIIYRSFISEQVDAAIAKNEDIDLGLNVIRANEASAAQTKASKEFEDIEGQVSERAETRGSRVKELQGLTQERLDVLNAGEIDSEPLIQVVKDARKASPKERDYPAIDIIRGGGGVRVGSKLDAELRNMGVTPKKFPGLFKKDSGLRDVDNLERDPDGIFAQIEGADIADANQDIFVGRDEFLDAVRSEVSGNPKRTFDQRVARSDADALAANSEEFIENLGLEPGATIKEIRAAISSAGREKGVVDAFDARISKMNESLEEFDKVTDKLNNRKLVSEASLIDAQKAVDDLEQKLAGAYELISASPRVKTMLEFANVKKELASTNIKAAPLRRRIKDIEKVKNKTEELDLELNAKKIDLGRLEDAAKKLDARVAKLEKFQPKKSDDVEAILDQADRDSYIDDITRATMDNILGRGKEGTPAWMMPDIEKRGPLNKRAFRIPANYGVHGVGQAKDFLEKDIELVMQRHIRVSAAELELTRKFGRADMRDQFEQIKLEADRMAVEAQKIEEPKARDKEVSKINKARKIDERNLRAFRDMIRGTFNAENMGNWGTRATDVAMTYQYIRLLGDVVASSAVDAIRPIAVHGMRAFMSEGIPNMVSIIRRANLSGQQVEELGGAVEGVMNNRMASLADLNDPYAQGSKFERTLNNISTIFTKATGLTWWNDTWKQILGVMSTNRIIRNSIGDFTKLDQFETPYMTRMGIDADMAQRISAQYTKYGEKDGVNLITNFGLWDDDAARRAFTSAINKDVDRGIVTKGVADQPIMSKENNLLRLAMQFKSFGIASHQKVLLSGLQERPHRLAEYMVFATAIGMIKAYYKYFSRGDEEGAERLLNNPGLWTAEGLDATGILSIPFEASNTMDKWGLNKLPGTEIPTTITGVAQAIAQDPDRGGSLSRYASRSPLGALAGPTAGSVGDAIGLLKDIANADLTKKGARAIANAVPGRTLPYVRPIYDRTVKPALVDFAD